MATRPIANTDQADAWDGDEGDYWARNEERYNAVIRGYSHRLLEAARIQPGERVLDIGCGCGESSRAAARASAPGRVLGVDLSAHMLARARERARSEGLAHAQFEQADAQVHPFEPAAFDVEISRFGVMFFSDPAAAFGNLRRALCPGGRLALLAWRGLEHNEWIREIRATLAVGRPLPPPPPGAPGPLGLSDPATVRPILAGAGFQGITFTAISDPMTYGHRREEVFDFILGTPMAQDVLSELESAVREKALDALRALLDRHQTKDGIQFQSSAWLIGMIRGDR